MSRFFDVINRNQSYKERRLNLSDFGIGDQSVDVICEILSKNG